jgi:prepilin-type N-terminal cleavage/methylation domain-containing protein
MTVLPHQKPSSKLKQRGFSLIELSVVISVAAAATVGYLSWTQPANIADSQKAIETRMKIEMIAKAVESFRVEKGRLPCPADPYMVENNTHNDSSAAAVDLLHMSSVATSGLDLYVNDYGTEDMDTSDTDNDTVRSLNQATTTGKITIGLDCHANVGAVPAHSLGLSNKYMTDGWGRKFTFQVSKVLCGSDLGTTPGAGLSVEASRMKGCTSDDYEDNNGDITVSSGSAVITSNASYVIISHGANGKGAFLPSGVKLADDGSGNEFINGNNYKTGATTVYKASTIDDMVYFKTKTQMERLTNRETAKQLSVDECNEVSSLIAAINLNEAVAMGDTITARVRGASYNSGQQVVLGMLMNYQSLCVKYYGAVAATVGNKTWGGPQCPGGVDNPNQASSRYNAAANTCTCSTNAWASCAYQQPFTYNTVAGLRLWLDANDSTTLFATVGTACTGGAATTTVGCWRDKSTAAGGTYNASGASAPTYNATGLNGKPTLVFNGSNHMTNAATVGNLSTGTVYTTYIVFQATAVVAGSAGAFYSHPALIADLGGSYLSYSFFSVSSVPYALSCAYSGSFVCATSSAVSLNTPYLVTLGHTSGNLLTVKLNNGSALTTSNPGPQSTASTLRIGSNYNSTARFTGGISEILWYNTTPSAGDDTIVQNYLKSKWGLW